MLACAIIYVSYLLASTPVLCFILLFPFVISYSFKFFYFKFYIDFCAQSVL